MLRFHLFHHDNVLNTDAKGSIFIIPWLVGYYVAGRQRNLRILDAGSDSDRSFVHIEIRANAVTCTVAVI
jgi:hypothetical protein